MKSVRSVFKIALMTVALVSVVILAMYAARMREFGESAGVQVFSLRTRLFQMNKQLEDLQGEACLLAEHLLDNSNQLSSASLSFDEEKKTNDPLRRQIESMLAESIRQKARLDRMKKDLRVQRTKTAKTNQELVELRTTNQNLMSDNYSLTTNNKELITQVETLQKKIDALTASRTGRNKILGSSVKTLHKESESLKVQLAEAAKTIQALEEQIRLLTEKNDAPNIPAKDN